MERWAGKGPGAYGWGPRISNESNTLVRPAPPPPPTSSNTLITGTRASFSETLICLHTQLRSGTESLSCTVKSVITDCLSTIVSLCVTCAGRESSTVTLGPHCQVLSPHSGSASATPWEVT